MVYLCLVHYQKNMGLSFFIQHLDAHINSVRYNAMHKPIKYKDKYYVIRTWKSLDHLWKNMVTEMFLEPENIKKDKILFVMTLFDLQTKRTAACNVTKRINREKK